MDFPKLIYDDFYKFFVSLGVILFVISLGLGIFLVNNLILNLRWIFVILCILAFVFSILATVYAGKKWYKNQKLLDQKLEAETEMIKHHAQLSIKPTEETSIMVKSKKDVLPTGDVLPAGMDDASIALVTYKIASVLPNTVYFNFLKDWQVWFLIENHERKKYKAYIKIKFISDNYEKELNGGYYGGVKAWNLNALTAIVAPGLDILEGVREKAKQRKRIEIEISCEIKDENDKLVEKKLPVGYVYDYENNDWYYEP